MPRPKPGDPILSALFAEVPSGETWEAGPRTAWLRMVEQRLNMKFGTLNAEGARITESDYQLRAKFLAESYESNNKVLQEAKATPAADGKLAFYVRENGEVWCEEEGKHPWPVKFEDKRTHHRMLWDQRTGPSQGHDMSIGPTFDRTDSIVWADCGTRNKGDLPPGMRLARDQPNVEPEKPGKEQGVLL